MELDNLQILVLIPCLNEARTIKKVVQDFQAALPQAEVLVFDNGSTDETIVQARQAGATICTERRRGKGFVVQAMFQKMQADIYVMVDGDDTYPAEKVRDLIEPILCDEADMVIGSRIAAESNSEFRLLNWLGNKFFQNIINIIFDTQLTDILSGYRCMNRQLVMSLPLFARGFEIEAEITIKSLQRSFRLVEIPVDLRHRVAGSSSKIRVLQDGFRILGMIFSLFRDYKPFTFFGSLALIIVALSLIPAAQIVAQLPLVDNIALLILAVGSFITGMIFFAVGLILHTVNRRFQEMEYFSRLFDQKVHEKKSSPK